MHEIELTEILKIAQEGEAKLKDMSNHATTMSEKWRVKTNTSINPENAENIHRQDPKVELL
ncbi:hypothetical protein UH38_23195 [Aliterella atlantica CENA595]|uniref:Uncharacterized protein n=1 Tax=Aliterella atlantica CENA595 TaxID=1618023 RepID=A0A0D8ZMJ0_9CYAN|nr:hypothetical protein UH38_23195 [Aliterella atlantica CENA595]